MIKENLNRYKLSPMDGEALLNYKGRLGADDLFMQLYDIDENSGEVVNPKEELDGTIFDGDCLSVCAYMKANDIKPNLVYIDPPFASNANYSKKVNLRIPKSKYKDTNLDESESSIGEEIMYGDIWAKEDYLNWLYTRLVAIREVMADDGCIYVHLDWHIGHYVKVMLDEIFGEENFINEIIWQYFMGGKGNKEFAKKHDTIFFYAKDKDNYTFNKFKVKRYLEYIPSLGDTSKNKVEADADDDKEENGVDEVGHYSIVACPDVWQISGVFNMSSEYTDYATQKPEALLERIIKASSDEGMLVADFFGGSGVTANVAYKMNRKFITCDVGKNAIQKIRDRLKESGASFEIKDIKDGLDLFRNPTQTMKKLFELCSGNKRNSESEYSNLWDGEIPYNKKILHTKIIDNSKVLDEKYLDYLLTQISQDNVNDEQDEYVVLYIYKTDDVTQKEIDKKIKELGMNYKVHLVPIEDMLKARSEQLNLPDSAVIEVTKNKNNKYEVKLKKYFSPYLKKKIDEENLKRVGGKGKKKEINLSDNGYELIEMISFDTTLGKKWISSYEEIIEPKSQTKGVFELETNKFKMKIRNIAGDELILSSEDFINE